ncbi:hypothetical protein CERSUDRAFT_108320 [Gelatoporia subvermispora B]|uniref:Uncharacterized protein n=1 Tax=Ceriporiopsis subvermispora (strain B) TaxID=914234 RepID=M2Q8F4_CERS8|nr:hypothetical protein CERSUDRAFT_108320 [Gelatoporia subvermispora B]
MLLRPGPGRCVYHGTTLQASKARTSRNLDSVLLGLRNAGRITSSMGTHACVLHQHSLASAPHNESAAVPIPRSRLFCIRDVDLVTTSYDCIQTQ